MAAAALRLEVAQATASSSSSHRIATFCSISVPCLGASSESFIFGSVAWIDARQQRSHVVARNCGQACALAQEHANQEAAGDGRGSRVIYGRCFVVGDNIDTDQIIPIEYLTLVPSKPEEYEKLGSYTMMGLTAQWGKFIEEGKTKTEYKVIIAGDNFGCGSSREHAPVALGAAGCQAVVAETYSRLFFRNCVSTGELYAVETQGKIWQENHSGDFVTLDMEKDILVNHTTGKQYNLKAIGDARPVIDAGGIFAYARSAGMIAS